MQKKCDKCGQLFSKESKREYLKGYTEDIGLCPGCNAVESVISRLKDNKDISKEELKILPKKLIFDPRDDNPQEDEWGHEFKNIIDGFINK